MAFAWFHGNYGVYEFMDKQCGCMLHDVTHCKMRKKELQSEKYYSISFFINKINAVVKQLVLHDKSYHATKAPEVNKALGKRNHIYKLNK
jgi:hypothetical protein